MANKEIIFQNAARDLGTGQFFALKLIDGGTVYTMYLEELTQPPRQPAIASQITATGVPVIAPSGAGDVIGIGTTNTIPLWTDGPNSVIGDSLLSQSGGNVVMASGNLVLAAAGLITFPDNVRQVFNPGAAAAGLNVGAVAVDPNTPINGDLWYDSALNLLRARIGGASVSLGAAAAVTVPLNLTGVSATAFTVAAAGTNYQLQVDTSVGSAVTGLKITGNAAGAGVTLASVSTGLNETIVLNPKGIGTVGLGGSTSAFPGLWHSGTFVEVVLADNSNYASLEAQNVVVRNRLGIGTAAAAIPTFPLEVIGDTISLTSSLNGLAGVFLTNSSAGANAQMFVRAQNNLAGHIMQVGIMGSNASVWNPIFSVDTVYLEAELAAGGIHIVSDSPTGHIEFFTNATALQDATARAMTIFETRGVAIGSTTDPGTGNLGVNWLNWSGLRRMTADLTNATTAFANLTDLTISGIVSGRKYVGKLVIKCNNTTATEGIKLDFAGGTATISAFWAAAAASVGGTTVLGTVISTSLAGVINFTTITGETLIVIEFSFVASGSGTLIPRFAENSTAVGTATVELGSYIRMDDSPN